MGPLPAAGTAPAQTHRTSPHRRAQPTARRTLAALAALLVAASTLTVIAAQPAAAHDVWYWGTVQRCAYDPFAGNQCWNEKARVPAHHSHPPPSCPAGTTGTPPNCSPVPSTNENHDPNADKDDDGADDGSRGDGSGDGSGSGGSSGDGSSGSGDGSDGDGSGGDDSGGDGSGGDDSGGDDSGGGDDVCPDGQTGTPPNCTEPNKNGKGGGSGGGSTTTTTDPCATWVSSTQNALNTANPDGTYNIPAVPSGCKTSTREMLGKLRVNTVTALDAVWAEIKKSLDKNYEATEANTAVYEEMAKTLDAAWKATPQPIRDVIKAGVCTALFATVMVAVVKSKGKIAKAAPFATNVYTVAEAGGCTLAVWALNAVTADDDDSGTDDDSDDSDDDSDDSDDDSGTDDADEDPEPTPGICDRNSAPTNPYKIGPSNTTPQQWADWWAWFDCP